MSFVLKTYFLLTLGFMILESIQAQTDSSDFNSETMTFDWKEDIVVTGAYAPVEARSHIHSIRSIDRETIERRGAIDLDELLQQELGLKIVQDAVLGSNLNLQGLSGEYVKVMIDGVPVIGRNGGNIDLGRINMANVERVEIVDGPLSTIYGNHALGGTIHVITKKQQEESLEGGVYAQWGGVGQYTAGANLGTQWKGFHWNGTYAFNYFDGFSQDTLREQTWNPKQQHHINSNLIYTLGNDFTVNYNFRTLEEKIVDRGAVKLREYPEIAYAKDYHFLTKTYDHALSYKGNLGNNYYLDGVAGYNHYNREKNAYFTKLLANPEEDEFDNLDSDTTLFRTWMMRTSLASQYAGAKANFLMGLDLNHAQGVGERIVADSNQNLATIADYAFYTSLNWQPIKSLSIQANGRIAYNSRYAAPITYGFQVKWGEMTSHWILRLAYARGFRAPSLKELYLDFVDANHFIKGNPNLRAERSHHVRLSVDYQQRFKQEHSVEWKSELFYNHLQNQIALYDFVEDSTGNWAFSSNPTYQYTYFNRDYFQNFGCNSRLSYTYKNLSLKLGFNIISEYNLLHEDNKTLSPFLFSYQLTQELTYRLPKYDLSFSILRNDFSPNNRYALVYNSTTQNQEVESYRVQAYSLMDIMANKTFFDKNLQLSVGLKNVLGVLSVQSTLESTGVHSSGGAVPIARGMYFWLRLSYKFKA